MNIIQRKVRGKQPRALQCEAPGCIRSARFNAVFLGTEYVPLCSKCSKAWSDAYANALRGWPDEEAGRIAEDYRSAA
jgi:hypothetical protein